MEKTAVNELAHWYLKNQRSLPWRQGKDAYAIWISETMLQQTTSVGVLPFYEKFLKKFPHLQSLAAAPLSEVLVAWAGLGYYSRAKNLHKCAQELVESDFPRTWSELIRLPGIGPYTARAISSLAFGEKVGVLDGNVIRVLSRFYNLPIAWWTTSGRKQLQELSDRAVQHGDPAVLNQAMMELGALLCRPQNPFCHLCPLAHNCQAKQKKTFQELPLRKPKKAKEIWHWKIYWHHKKGKIALTPNNYLPFLRGQWVFPGQAAHKARPPKVYSLKHHITHHEIYANIKSTDSLPSRFEKIRWVKPDDFPKINPSSLLQKTLRVIL